MAVSQMVDWNALELVGEFVPIVQNFVKVEQFRTNAMLCLHSIVHKGMDASSKVELIHSIQYLSFLESIQVHFPDRSDDADPEEQTNEEEFLVAVTSSVDKVG